MKILEAYLLESIDTFRALKYMCVHIYMCVCAYMCVCFTWLPYRKDIAVNAPSAEYGRAHLKKIFASLIVENDILFWPAFVR